MLTFISSREFVQVLFVTVYVQFSPECCGGAHVSSGSKSLFHCRDTFCGRNIWPYVEKERDRNLVTWDFSEPLISLLICEHLLLIQFHSADLN